VYSNAGFDSEALAAKTINSWMKNRPPGGARCGPLDAMWGWLATLIVVSCLGPNLGLGAEPGWRQLSGHVPTVVSQLTPLGPLPGNTNLSLAIGLPLRDPAGLAKLLDEIYDPHSTNYHHFLSPAEFTARFGPTLGDYQSVIQFAEAHDLRVSGRHPNRVVLDVQGSVARIEAAFQTTLHTYQHPTEARQFYAPDVEPSVPTNVPVADMWGLSDYGRPHSMVHLQGAAIAHPLNYNGTAPSGYYQGSDFRHAYVPGTSLAGSGQSVALVEFDGYNAADITTYESNIGYTNVPLQNILLDGVSGAAGYGNSTYPGLEVSLDIDMALSMAPALAKIYVYEGQSPYDVYNRIVTDNQAKQVGSSWYFDTGPGNRHWSGGTGVGTLDKLLMEMAAQGQSFFQASGDADADTGSQAVSSNTGPIPVDSIYVTSVGATSLSMNGSAASWSGETVWNQGNNVGSGGGVSANYPIPAWQKGVSMAVNSGSTTSRNFPDVAMAGDTIYVIYNNGQPGYVGGTSCAAPLWAGFCALLNQQFLAMGGSSVGLLNPALYSVGTNALYPNFFHDITTGNNIGNNTAGLYYATNGYDLCTGLGTPNGTNLINALAPPLQPFFFVQPQGQNLTSGSTFTLTAAAGGVTPQSFQWLCNGTNLAAGGNISGVTTNALTISSATTNNAGSYTLVVNNPNGSATSVVAVVNIGFAPGFATQPAPLTVFAGSNAVFSVANTGSTPFSYQWRENNTNLANGPSFSGVNTSQLTILAATTNASGIVSVAVSNLYGSSTSSAAALTVVQPPFFPAPLPGQTIQCSSNATFGVSAIATPDAAYQWSLDGTPIAGATKTTVTLTNLHLPSHTLSLVATNLYGTATNSAILTVQDTQPPVITLTGANPLYVELGSSFTDPGATANDACAGNVPVMVQGLVNTSAVGTNFLVYQAADGSGNTGTATRTVIVRDTTPPVILWSFTNLVLAAGSNCDALLPDVTGTNFIQATDLSGTTLITLSPATNTVLALGTNLVLLTVSDPSGNQSFSTNTIVVADETPPVLVTQPQNVTNLVGTTASFSVTATACTPLSYQWWFASAPIPGQTNASLSLTNVTAASAGNYAVVVTAAGGSTSSALATLTVTVPVVLSMSNLPGSGFDLTATGPVGATCIFEMTTNLLLPAAWLPLFTNAFGPTGTAQFLDTSATNDLQRFYRVQTGP